MLPRRLPVSLTCLCLLRLVAQTTTTEGSTKSTDFFRMIGIFFSQFHMRENPYSLFTAALFCTVILILQRIHVCRQQFTFVSCFSCANSPTNSVVFLETAGFFQIMTPQALFLHSQQPPRKSLKLPARRADVTAAGRARPRGFVLLSRRSVQHPTILPVSVFPTFATSGFSRCHLVLFRCFLPTLPYSGATSGFQASGGDTLDCVLKAAQTADTGATGCDWRFGCAINLCFQ